MDESLRGDETAAGIAIGPRTRRDTESEATAEPTVDERSTTATGDRDDGT